MFKIIPDCHKNIKLSCEIINNTTEQNFFLQYSKKYSKLEDARGYFKDVRYHIYRSYDESARSRSLSRPKSSNDYDQVAQAIKKTNSCLQQ